MGSEKFKFSQNSKREKARLFARRLDIRSLNNAGHVRGKLKSLKSLYSVLLLELHSNAHYLFYVDPYPCICIDYCVHVYYMIS